MIALFLCMYGWISPEMAEELMERQQEAEAKAAEDKAKKEAEAEKTPEEKLIEAKQSTKVAGERFCSRVLGMLDREAGRLVDQYPILDGREEETKCILRRSFFAHLDKHRVETKLMDNKEL